MFYNYYAYRKKHPIGTWVHKIQAKKIIEIVKKYAQKSQQILEIGPGDGYFAENCILDGFSYAGIEGNREVARKLKKKIVHIIQAYVPPIPMKSRCVNVCCLFHVLEHMSNLNQASGLINEIKRVLGPSGLLFIACPNYDSWGRDFYSDYTHNFVTSPRRISQFVSDFGFDVISVVFYSGPVFGSLRFPVLFLNRLLFWRLLNRFIKSELYYKGFLSFLECFLVIARVKNGYRQ